MRKASKANNNTFQLRHKRCSKDSKRYSTATTVTEEEPEPEPEHQPNCLCSLNQSVPKDIYLFVPTTGTTVGVPQETLALAQQKVDAMVDENNIIPDRGDLDDPTIQWRHGKPNYSLANLAYFEGKTKSHMEGSLELIVENLVKTWEMEASHKMDFSQWTSVQHDVYSFGANNGQVFKTLECVERGNYNVLLDDCKTDLYDAKNETFDSSHHHFRTAFPNGFPWELLDVYCGPPRVAFTWRHWANFDGEYKGNNGKGELVEMVGTCIATVNNDLKVQSLQVFYKPEPFLEMLEGIRPIPKPQQDKVRTLLDVNKLSALNLTDAEQNCPFLSATKLNNEDENRITGKCPKSKSKSEMRCPLEMK